ncbi:MarR family transcriptional regulator [Candidatus Uabimicrobium sp. HlEnr_7]|uniref:MarR family transcriptional regulator n=1 Tax=Candidatus Uabimicrobium helgolandensis TaxID=3095367 RepID=UPI003555F8A1
MFFGRSIYIPPLKKEEVIKAIEKRYSILKLPNREVIKPFEDDFINYLYDVYRGKIRFIMEAANTLVPFLSRKNPQTLPSKVACAKLQEILYEDVMEKITPQEWEVLNVAVKAEYFTNKDIVEALKISKPNVSRIIKKLSQNQLITTIGKKGRYVSYQVFEDIRIIIDSDAEKSVKSNNKKRFSTVEKRTQKAIKNIKRKITTKEYASTMNVSINIARNDLKYLVLNNEIVKKGSTKKAYFILKN